MGSERLKKVKVTPSSLKWTPSWANQTLKYIKCRCTQDFFNQNTPKIFLTYFLISILSVNVVCKSLFTEHRSESSFFNGWINFNQLVKLGPAQSTFVSGSPSSLHFSVPGPLSTGCEIVRDQGDTSENPKDSLGHDHGKPSLWHSRRRAASLNLISFADLFVCLLICFLRYVAQ